MANNDKFITLGNLKTFKDNLNTIDKRISLTYGSNLLSINGADSFKDYDESAETLLGLVNRYAFVDIEGRSCIASVHLNELQSDTICIYLSTQGGEIGICASRIDKSNFIIAINWRDFNGFDALGYADVDIRCKTDGTIVAEYLKQADGMPGAPIFVLIDSFRSVRGVMVYPNWDGGRINNEGILLRVSYVNIVINRKDERHPVITLTTERGKITLKPNIEAREAAYDDYYISSIQADLSEFSLEGGTSDSAAIVDVDKLPTEDIDGTKLYRVDGGSNSSGESDHKLFAVGAFNDDGGENTLAGLETNLNNAGLVKDKDYFERLAPVGSGEIPPWTTYIIAFDFAKYMTSTARNPQSVDVQFVNVANFDEVNELMTSLNGATPTQEETEADTAKLIFAKLDEPYYNYPGEATPSEPSEDDEYWTNVYCIPCLIGKKTGDYQANLVELTDFSGNAFDKLSLYLPSPITNRYPYKRQAETLPLSDMSEFADAFDGIIDNSGNPSDYLPRQLWVEINKKADDAGAKLYNYYKGAWQRVGAGGSSDYATTEDIELIFGVLGIDNDVSIENETMTVGNDATIKGKDHLLDLDGE